MILSSLRDTRTIPFQIVGGAELAIATRESHHKGVLRIYDVKSRGCGRHTSRVPLESYPNGVEAEVNDMAYSPCGRYIALGRQDNRTHIYDVRMMEQVNDKSSILYEFAHEDGRKRGTINPGQESFGICKVAWVREGEREGLVTAGSDGTLDQWSRFIS